MRQVCTQGGAVFLSAGQSATVSVLHRDHSMKFMLWALCMVGLGSAGPGAQGAPDFSGTWTMDLTRSEAAAQGTPIGPVTMAIRQTPAELRIETNQNGISQTTRYVLGGKDSAREEVGTFRWDGAQLITSLVTYINHQAVTVEEARSLNPLGTEMTVKVTLVVQHGYQLGDASTVPSKNAPNTSTGTNVFLKARQPE
jgi:hypothetical protein